MMNDLQLQKSRVLLIVMLLMCATLGFGQQYKQGIRSGLVKVKFASEMSSSLSSMNVTARNNRVTTGITKFDAVASEAKATNIYRLFPYDAKNEAKLIKHGLHLWYVVEIDKQANPQEVASKFKQLAEIAIAEVEREKVLSPYSVREYVPTAGANAALPFNDPMLKDQWHYDNVGQSGFGDADINLFSAWTKTTGASNIVVSIHDMGVDVNHPDLKANIWVNQAEANGQPNVDDDGNGYVDDINGYNFQKNKGAVDAEFHGTHVAGTIAAVNNNGIGVSGIAGGSGNGNGVKVMSLQILGGAAIEKSFVYAANNGSVISQNSWGYTSPYFVEQVVLDAIDYFVAEAGDFPGSPMKGGIVIFAAGNSNSNDEWYPGYYSNTMSVGAFGPEWIKTEYSNYGDWVDISAPGGAFEYGSKSGVLSTIPGEKYAYLEGTSMACPHVSGIAALALANRTKQLTSAELWNKLVTGVVDLDAFNENYVGNLGSGAIDANLAIQNDLGLAPSGITDLSVTGIAQEFATLSWSVPTDEDDQKPSIFQLYYHTEPLIASNLSAATKVSLTNKMSSGSTYTYEVQNLLGLTTYYFAVTSIDRWGNTSVLSNVASETTNAGPSIAIDENSQFISLTIDASASTSATHEITLLNEADGILRWNHFMRHSSGYLAYNASAINYPTMTFGKRASEGTVAKLNVKDGSQLRNNDPQALAYTAIEKSYAYWASNIIGETNIALTNSAAAKFQVTEADGFNLTQARMYLKHDPALGPVVMEIYLGETPTKGNLVYAQEHSNWSADETWAYITLNEQIYFESGSTFWMVFHVPAGNLFPLGIGYEADPTYSENCYMSFDLGNTWTPLEEALNSKDFAWAIGADSYNEYLGTYLTLSPGSGDINGNEQAITTLTADASTLINGSYSANMVITSNDASNQELRIPVSLEVTGHQPMLKHIDIADFGSVFQGTSKTVELVIENTGFGNFNDPVFSIDNSDFIIEDYAPWQIQAREEVVLKVKFAPTGIGNTNGLLSISNGNQSYEISLFGVSAETSKISINPESQTVDNVAIGDVVTAQITVENTGAFPLKYFIPGYDQKGISADWPSTYHSYGYKYRTSYPSDLNPIAYEFQDISTTGEDITDPLRIFAAYKAVDMGFDFPYYGESMKTLYIARQGFTTFNDEVPAVNVPSLNNIYNPRGYVSPLGTFIDLSSQGAIFYQVEADRVIVQWDNVSDGYNPPITAQMVLYADGNIRFFYENMGYDSWSQSYLNILIEDLNQTDGILIHNYEKPMELYNGLALGFDYPGPNIITAITNGSGILAPGASAQLEITLATESLVEGITNRYLNFICNEPAKTQSSALVQLNITSGGLSMPVVSISEATFGDVFQGDSRAISFTIKNEGSAVAQITDLTFTNGDFLLTGEQPVAIAPGLYKKYSIAIPTSAIANLDDQLTINFLDGSSEVIHVTGNVVVPPAINVDLSGLIETLAYGDASSHPITIENTGLATLEVTTVGKHWMTFETQEKPTTTSYTYDKHNDGQFYQWIDIRETGTHMPLAADIFDKTQYWKDLTLPFTFNFYGQDYSTIKIGESGLISLDEDPDALFFTDYIPSVDFPGTFIMPYWTFGGFDTYFYPADEVGVFYQFYTDKVIITWSYLINNFGGMGDPVSAQVILYPNGSMKFQYRVEEGGLDLTSNFTVVGVQKDSENAVAVSQYNNLDHGNGLAFILSPASTYEVAPGLSMAANIKLEAKHIYGGTYNEALKIQTNVPGMEHLEKPVELTVTGDAIMESLIEVNFGNQLVAFEYGSPINQYIDLEISNSGSAPFDITWAAMTDGYQGLSMQIYALVDGWFGPELRWADISELYSPWAWVTPVYTVNPGDQLKARAAFGPSYGGDFADELVLTTSLGEIRIPMTGTGVEPPAMEVDVTPISVAMNGLSGTETASISFNNLNGFSDLSYEMSIDFGRTGVTASNTERLSSGETPVASLKYSTVYKDGATVQSTSATYNRVITYTDKTTPDTFVGTGGSAPFSIATSYNAGASGFNLSHVQAYFRSETITSEKINVEIRAGGTSIAEAVVIGSGEVAFTGSGDDEAGDWIEIPLIEAVGIYPNEDFYVILTYPLGIEFPQGTIANVETTPGRYFYYDEGTWYNIQEVNSFETMGWLMYAAEETAGNSSWLTITSSLSGTMAAGAEGTVELMMEGSLAQRGDQVAHVVFSSNDPNHSTVKVPVSLHVNEAPQFSGIPEGLQVHEKEIKTIVLGVSDMEGNAFEVTSIESYAGLTYAYENGLLTITLTPDYGTAGTYTYGFKAIDEYNAESEVTLVVEVLHTNQAPKYMGPEGGLTFGSLLETGEYSIADFFMDPDGDAITFSAISNSDEVAVVFTSLTKFIVMPMAVGQTSLSFVVTDSHSATFEQLIPVQIEVVSGIQINDRFELNAYPNPTSDFLTLNVGGESAATYSIRILNMAGEPTLEVRDIPAQKRSYTLSLEKLPAGVYLVEISDVAGSQVERIVKDK